MENGFYLYCIRPHTDVAIEVSRTISGKGEILAIPFLELEALTSEVSLDEFGSDEIRKKAEEDLDWIKMKAQVHEEVVEQAMREGDSISIPVIPMQFGVIFRTKEKLLESMYLNLERFRDNLGFIKGRQEWGIKAFLDQKAFDEIIENANEEIQAKKREAELLPKGMAFFAKKQAASKIEEIKDNELSRITIEIKDNLARLAVSLHKAKILEKDFTRMTHDMVFNVFCLVDQSELDEFKAVTHEMKEKYLPFGIEIEMSGPWPSYHFAIA